MPKLSYLVIPCLALMLVACGGGGGDNGDDGHPTDLDEAIRIVEEYTCTDEYEQAVEYTVLEGYDTAVPVLWDGTPFVVDVSSTFLNADDLLDVIADEAARIDAVLGYEIFVAGDVLPLADLTASQLFLFDSGSQLVPLDQHIEIRCCYGADTNKAGTSFAWWRMVLLENDAFQSRHIIMHELYHIFGFAHPDEDEGVVMSESLMRGPGHDAAGASIPTGATPTDLAKLACIYD